MEYSIKLLNEQLLNLNLALNRYKNSKEFNPQSVVYKETQEKIRDLEKGIKILKESKI